MSNRFRVLCLCVFVLLALTLSVHAQDSSTLELVQERGHIICISHSGYPGFGFLDEEGNFSGFDTDFCRATAAAIFGDADAHEILPASSADRFTFLATGEGDVIYRTTTWTLSRDTDNNAQYAVIYFYDGQGLMAPTSLGVSTIQELDGATICTDPGTTSELNIADAFAARGLEYTPLPIEDDEEAWNTYLEGRCDVRTTDRSYLASYASTAFPNPEEHMVLDITISKEPLAHVVRNGDDQWLDIIQWVTFALINAEEYGVTSENVDDFLDSEDPVVRRMLGTEDDFGGKLGLPSDWVYQMIKQVGNYGEMFDCNLGAGSPLNLPRGPNALWTDGGLIYAPPFR